MTDEEVKRLCQASYNNGYDEGYRHAYADCLAETLNEVRKAQKDFDRLMAEKLNPDFSEED